jgi:hypothetical protein
MQNWVAPSEIAGLLLMRRDPKPFPAHYERSGYRVLGVIIPDLDDVLRMETSKLPSRASTLLKRSATTCCARMASSSARMSNGERSKPNALSIAPALSFRA